MSELLSDCLLKVTPIKPKLLIDDDLIIILALYKDLLPVLQIIPQFFEYQSVVNLFCANFLIFTVFDALSE
jgi:hypothetical protein